MKTFMKLINKMESITSTEALNIIDDNLTTLQNFKTLCDMEV